MTTKDRRYATTVSIALLVAALGASAAHADTQVEAFDSASLAAPWAINNAFDGQPGSISIADGACTFRKTGETPGFTQSLSLAEAYLPIPWSIGYTVLQTSSLVKNGGGLCHRFSTSQETVYDGVYILNEDGKITVRGARKDDILYTFPENSLSLLKVQFNVSTEGIIVFATTDIGSFGQGKLLAWQRPVTPESAIGVAIAASDASASSASAFSVSIDNLSLATDSSESKIVPQFTPQVPPGNAKNFIQNASFECSGDLWSSLGVPTAWGGDLSGLYGVIEEGSAWHGAHSLRIDLGPGVSPTTCFDAWPPSHLTQNAPLTVNIGWMPVKKGQPLTLSCYMRASTDGIKARLKFFFSGSALGPINEASHEVALTTTWARYTVTQEALNDSVCIAAGPDLSGTPEMKASVWLDAIQLETAPEATAFEARDSVELGFDSEHYGNVFPSSEPVEFAIWGNNEGVSDVRVPVRLECEDFFGKKLPAQEYAIEIAAHSQARTRMQVSLPGKGYYRAHITWPANGQEYARTLVFSVIQPYTEQDSPFGLNHPATTEAQLKLFSQGGIRWVRTWAINWDWVEPVQGQVSWAEQDAQMKYLKDAGMNTLAVFPNPSAGWASSAPDTVADSMWYRLAYAPKEPQLLFDFIGQAVNRYKDSCTHWEFLNEPLWVPDFCLPQSGGYKVPDYIKLLDGAYKAQKLANPDSKLIGGLAIQPEFPYGDEFITAGGLQYCDYFNLHPYGGFTLPEAFIEYMGRVLQAIDAKGIQKPIWATETSYYGVDDKPWTPWVAPPGHFSANLLLADERTCAEYIVRHALILMAHRVEKIFYHEPIEGPVYNGIMDIENTFFSPMAIPKKSYPAISALANLLGASPQCAGPAAFPAVPAGAKVYGYAFQCGSKAVLAIWNTGDAMELTQAQLSSDVTVYDMMGNPVSPPLTLNGSPLYLVSTACKADALAKNWFVQETAAK